jgi:xylulokinase
VRDDSGLLETHAYPGGAFFIENPGWLSGGSIAWISQLLNIPDLATLNALAAEVPAGADGLSFLPALTGAMAPEWRPAARGCFYGMTPAHGRGHMARAVLEGCAFAMRDVVDRLDQMGVDARALLLIGGGAHSRLWAQMRADIVQRPARLPNCIDCAPIGAARLAAVAGARAIWRTRSARTPTARYRADWRQADAYDARMTATASLPHAAPALAEQPRN